MPNALGIAVGAKLEAVKAVHPAVRITPHKYDPAGHYLFFAGPQGTSSILMEERVPAVEYVESCL